MTVQNPFRYRGSLGYSRVYGGYVGNTLQERGGYTLYNAGARTYHTGIGRWLQEDPLLGIVEEPSSFNRFAYCDANAVGQSDPFGFDGVSAVFGMEPGCAGTIAWCDPANPDDQPPANWAKTMTATCAIIGGIAGLPAFPPYGSIILTGVAGLACDIWGPQIWCAMVNAKIADDLAADAGVPRFPLIL